MEHPNLAIVTGAYGYTGGCVARMLIDKGVRVRTGAEGVVVGQGVPICELFAGRS